MGSYCVGSELLHGGNVVDVGLVVGLVVGTV
jgi:hypothetical protein